MIRQIVNTFRGRTETQDENPELQAVLDLLNRLNGKTKGTIKYEAEFSYTDLRNVAPRDMASFVGDKFKLGLLDYYTDIWHQVFSGEADERHYLDLVHGKIAGTFGETVIRSRPFKRASISFVVEKQK